MKSLVNQQEEDFITSLWANVYIAAVRKGNLLPARDAREAVRAYNEAKKNGEFEVK